MQIHELNTFEGELTSGVYIAVDGGDDTAKTQVTNITAGVAADLAQAKTDLNGRINNIVSPSGTAPNPDEIIDARYGADGVQYTNLGTAIRTQVTDLKNDLNYLSDWLKTSLSVTDGYFIDGSGNLITNSLYSYTDFIPIDKTEILYVLFNPAERTAPWLKIATYNATRNFIARVDSDYSGSTWVESPTYTKWTNQNDNVKYIKLTFNTASNVSAYVSPESVYTKQIADLGGQIGDLQADLADFGEPYTGEDAQNLFDKTTVVKGYYYNASGVRTGLSSYCHTDYIPLRANSYYRWSSHGIFNYYDADKNWVASETKNSSVSDYSSGLIMKDHPNYAYVIISTEIANLDLFMIVNSSVVPTEYKPFQYENKMRLAEKSVGAKSAEFAKPNYENGNIIDLSAFHFEGYYYDQNGVKTFFNSYGYSDLIPVYSGLRYYTNAPCFFCEYDSNETFIRGGAITASAGGTFDTSATTAYVRLSADRQYSETFAVYTSAIVESLPFRYTLDEKYIRVPKTTDGKKIVCVGDSLTQGVDYGSHVIKENYPYFMSDVLNCGIINYGKAGMSSLAWWQNYKNSCPFDPTMDVVLIMFGTNGGLDTNTLATDVEPYNNWADYAETSVGCYCKLIEHIMEDTSNHAQIILLTPPYSTYATWQEQAVINSEATIRAIAKRYQLPVIDVLNECGMGKFNGTVFRPHDGCHFNAKGYHRLGTFLASRLLSYFSTFNLTDVYDDEYVGS